ncbi:hypothetical protein DPMN_172317 [Dreissena polymorpha]|uniref:Uncharacterized protein n=1 Tax=Dreissena polymorpha TaxID=45954 RepID=A0A9D4E3E4_DREPO|nr:hypothetical protein DPMN_172317 [Dreissena polymorpha]
MSNDVSDRAAWLFATLKWPGKNTNYDVDDDDNDDDDDDDDDVDDDDDDDYDDDECQLQWARSTFSSLPLYRQHWARAIETSEHSPFKSVVIFVVVFVNVVAVLVVVVVVTQ